MRSDLIRAVLECGIDDLGILDEAEADMYDTVSKLREEGKEISLQSITEEIFEEGIFRMGEAVKNRRKELEDVERKGKLSEEEYEQLESMRLHELNPAADFGHEFNFLATNLYCDSEKKEVYEEWFEEEMQELMDYTGFNVNG